ncbi:unnamed protein product, partial [Owenia fusiformis]
DPVMVNPNSFNTLKVVLRETGKATGCKRYTHNDVKRQWLNVCFDGLPYALKMKIVFNFVTCSLCQMELEDMDDLNSHMEEHHILEDDKFFKEFDLNLLRVGDGHYEMNLIKSHE